MEPRTPPSLEAFERSINEYNWFLKALDEGIYTGEVVLLRNREVIGHGRTHTKAWENALARAAEAGTEPPKKNDCLAVVVPPAFVPPP